MNSGKDESAPAPKRWVNSSAHTPSVARKERTTVAISSNGATRARKQLGQHAEDDPQDDRTGPRQFPPVRRRPWPASRGRRSQRGDRRDSYGPTGSGDDGVDLVGLGDDRGGAAGAGREVPLQHVLPAHRIGLLVKESLLEMPLAFSVSTNDARMMSTAAVPIQATLGRRPTPRATRPQRPRSPWGEIRTPGRTARTPAGRTAAAPPAGW